MNRSYFDRSRSIDRECLSDPYKAIWIVGNFPIVAGYLKNLIQESYPLERVIGSRSLSKYQDDIRMNR